MPIAAHRFQLRSQAEADASPLEEVRYQLGSSPAPGPAVLACANRLLTLPDLRAIQQALAEAGLDLMRVEALEALTLVPAAALGLETQLERPQAAAAAAAEAAEGSASRLSIHRGTLRSGDHLQVEGSLLLLGDVNPGARVSAAGDVRVWGRLRGVAHAGCRGNREAKIVALQLRPLQLRIADAVARGPEDRPPPGYCEAALLRDGAISIEPAEPHWPAELG